MIKFYYDPILGLQFPSFKKPILVDKIGTVSISQTIHEYLLIHKKQSKLSRSKREYIERQVKRFVSQKVLTQEELNLIKPNANETSKI